MDEGLILVDKDLILLDEGFILMDKELILPDERFILMDEGLVLMDKGFILPADFIRLAKRFILKEELLFSLSTICCFLFYFFYYRFSFLLFSKCTFSKGF